MSASPSARLVRLYALFATPLRLVDDGIPTGIMSETDRAASWVAERLPYDDVDVERVVDAYLDDVVVPACRRVAEEAGAAAVGAFYADTLRRALDAVAPSLPPGAAPLEALRTALSMVAAQHRHAELAEAVVEALLGS